MKISSRLKKTKKFIRTPRIFFRDYLNNKYPVRNTETLVDEQLEQIIINNNLTLAEADASCRESLPIDVVFTWVNNKEIEQFITNKI